MVVNIKSKANKRRASRTHGWGSPKKHRGAGSRGGVGNAGAGKKGQQNMTTKHLTGERIGQFGFKRPPATLTLKATINLDELEKLAAKLNLKELDLVKLGYDKVLGRGKIESKLKITSYEFSKKAEEKIKAAGGEATVPNAE